jgi:putative restriction endonuclease
LTLSSIDIVAGLESNGFNKLTENSKTIGFSAHGQTVYVKQKTKRHPLIVHPDNQNRFTELKTINGVVAENSFRFYHNSTMRMFPERRNAGLEATKYGIAFGFDGPNSLDAFIGKLLFKNPSTLSDDLMAIIALGDKTVTEREYLFKARVGQGIFRDSLIEEFKGKCQVTGISRPELLRASHIKPWRFSNNVERLETKNGLLLAVHIDCLFDSGFIGFDRFGNMRTSSFLTREELAIFGIDKPVRISTCPTRAIYLDYHEKNVFQV